MELMPFPPHPPPGPQILYPVLTKRPYDAGSAVSTDIMYSDMMGERRRHMRGGNWFTDLGRKIKNEFVNPDSVLRRGKFLEPIERGIDMVSPLLSMAGPEGMAAAAALQGAKQGINVGKKLAGMGRSGGAYSGGFFGAGRSGGGRRLIPRYVQGVPMVPPRVIQTPRRQEFKDMGAAVARGEALRSSPRFKLWEEFRAQHPGMKRAALTALWREQHPKRGPVHTMGRAHERYMAFMAKPHKGPRKFLTIPKGTLSRGKRAHTHRFMEYGEPRPYGEQFVHKGTLYGSGMAY